ncbi:MAG: NAD(P)H-hydrate dehydratase [Gemmataceae bacterium]
MTPSPSPLQRVVAVPHLPPRPRDGHKGTFGKVLLVAGSQGMSGAAILAGTAALRGGAGLVQVAVPAPIGPIVAGGHPCYMTLWLPADAQGRLDSTALPLLLEAAQAASAVLIGPGLGATPEVGALVRGLAEQVPQPLLLDADALNSLGPHPDLLGRRPGPTVLTPHPGEFARLIGADTRAVQADREVLATAFARRHNVVLILKGAGTIVCDPGSSYVNTTGNPGMGTGGTGDVLSGLVGALLAQGLAALEAAILGVYLHGLAGDLAATEFGETSLVASDLLTFLPAAFQRHAAD